jgi:hypothetical protein
MVGHDWGWVGRFGLGWVGGGAWEDRISIAKSIPSDHRIFVFVPPPPRRATGRAMGMGRAEI